MSHGRAIRLELILSRASGTRYSVLPAFRPN